MRFLLFYRIRLLLGVLIVCLSAATSFVACAQEAHPARGAIALGHEALAAFERSDFAQADLLFRKAEEIAHSPVFVLYEARCARAMLYYRKAIALFERVSAEQITDKSPQTWVRAVRDAATERQLLESIVPRLEIALSGDIHLPARLWLLGEDGQELNVLKLTRADLEVGAQRAMAADPGTYQLRFEDAAGQRSSQLWRATAAQTKQLHLYFGSRSEKKIGSQVKTARPVDVTSSQAGRSLRTGAYVAFSGGGALWVTGLIFGGLALNESSRVRHSCADNTCPYEEYSRAQHALAHARLASAAFVSGALSLGVGSGLLLLDRRYRTSVVASQGGGVVYWGGDF